jgi:hypothetical protein
MSELGLHAFLDESRKPIRDGATGGVSPRGDHYVISACVVLEGTVDESWQHLKALRRQLGFPFHFSQLGERRQHLVVERLMSLDSWDGYVYESSQPLRRSTPERRMRDRILRAAFQDLALGHGVREFTLESRATPKRGQWTLNRHDHSTLTKAMAKGLVPKGSSISHATKSEPILWIADVIASCRSDYLCGRDRSVFPLLAHRVRKIHRVDF